ncbi:MULTISPECIES: helix-turn-helix domain-containing protein [Blautia]|uniref:helix-turn-helix domain-containing protein n=1 Tax=Blautia TaxID=572511 RepID=UPI000BA393F7|nr:MULTISPECIES: helix-turn-helix transcriptional regulator [Blautia]
MGLKENIKAKRIEKQMTLEELACKVGVSRQTIQRYESGTISNIPSDKIELMAKALETTPAYLMGWSDRSSSEEVIANIMYDVMINEDMQILLEKTKKMNKNTFKRLSRYADFLLEEEKEEK